MTDELLQIAVIVGSTRAGRFGEVVSRWFIGEAPHHIKADLDVIDLATTPLPVVQQEEPVYTGRYTAPEVRALARRIDLADGFVVITPEYNHIFPASLKLAIDSIYREWQAKPVAFVSYGGLAGGQRAVEHLRPVFAELRMVTARNTVSFHMAHDKFDEAGQPVDPVPVNRAMAMMLGELAWWADALRTARADVPFPG